MFQFVEHSIHLKRKKTKEKSERKKASQNRYTGFNRIFDFLFQPHSEEITHFPNITFLY